ncbi:MAG: hypothetical protein UZ04_CHB001001397 [Chlorobi bacterium OLB4]|jgi:hypothetical protein|nr:MAG: hypothetical protein UZ04_CHB001001397 [Chlorobi bacterium OLB4]
MNKAIILIFLLIINTVAIAEWDLKIDVGPSVNCFIRLKTVSVPFEGYNRADKNLAQFNRVGVALNGDLHRRFYTQNLFTERSHIFFEYTGAGGTRLVSSFSETGPTNYYGWTYAKYLFEIVDLSFPSDTFKFYWNALDSKIGSRNWQNEVYFRDWEFKYRVLPSNERAILIFGKGGEPVEGVYYDTVFLSDQYKEIKLWKLLYDREQPWERNFYARTTPFPISNINIYIDPNDPNALPVNEYTLGTTIIFDTIYPKFDDPVLGDTNKYGYNTIMDINYYFNPLINPAERGNHLFTPGRYALYQYINHNKTFTTRIIAQENDTLIIDTNKHFWINGTTTVSFEKVGDQLIFEDGSHLNLMKDASIRVIESGSIVDKGATKDFSSGSFVTVMANSKLIVDGLNVTYPANARIEIEANGYLILKDNSTLIFDGEGAHLEIHPDANLILGENSKIEFRNGAYLDADGITFSGNNGAIWGGLVFHNAGGQTQIKNCTFNDAKISIDIKNTTGCYAGLEKRITGNTFNQPSIGSHSIRAENVFKLLLQGNTFNIAANKTGVEILNRINAGNSQEDGGN